MYISCASWIEKRTHVNPYVTIGTGSRGAVIFVLGEFNSKVMGSFFSFYKSNLSNYYTLNNTYSYKYDKLFFFNKRVNKVNRTHTFRIPNSSNFNLQHS